MLKKITPQFFILLTYSIFSGLIIAQTTTQTTLYITDKIYAPLRSEEGEKGKTINDGLISGAPITLLSKNEKTGYAKIRTADNIEGWIRLQYVSAEPSADLQLEQANGQIAQLQAAKKAIELELATIRQISASQIDVHKRNAELVKQNQLLISEKEVLQMDNNRLKDRNSRTWFLYGGFLVAISCLVAAIIPRLTKKRRNDGWM